MDGSLSIHNMKIFIDDLLGKKSIDFWGILDMITKQKEAMTTSSDRNHNGGQEFCLDLLEPREPMIKGFSLFRIYLRDG